MRRLRQLKSWATGIGSISGSGWPSAAVRAPTRHWRSRAISRAESDSLNAQVLAIDGYNVLTSIEAALAGGIILEARDGCFRDVASVHGTWRKVHETVPAIRNRRTALNQDRRRAGDLVFGQPGLQQRPSQNAPSRNSRGSGMALGNRIGSQPRHNLVRDRTIAWRRPTAAFSTGAAGG